jgi:hypothetical protein
VPYCCDMTIERYPNGQFKDCRGSNHPRWKGGETIDRQGYIHVYNPTHPYRDYKNRVLKHRLIYEHYLLILTDDEIFIPETHDIHHTIPVNEGGTNALANLQLLTRAEHRKTHFINPDITNRLCLFCGGKTCKRKKGYETWHKYQGGFICDKCHQRERRKKEKSR